MSIPEDLFNNLKPLDKIVYWVHEEFIDGESHYLMSLCGKKAADLYRSLNGNQQIYIRVYSWIGKLERNLCVEVDGGFDHAKNLIEDMFTKTHNFRILTEKEALLL